MTRSLIPVLSALTVIAIASTASARRYSPQEGIYEGTTIWSYSGEDACDLSGNDPFLQLMGVSSVDETTYLVDYIDPETGEIINSIDPETGEIITSYESMEYTLFRRVGNRDSEDQVLNLNEIMGIDAVITMEDTTDNLDWLWLRSDRFLEVLTVTWTCVGTQCDMASTMVVGGVPFPCVDRSINRYELMEE